MRGVPGVSEYFVVENIAKLAQKSFKSPTLITNFYYLPSIAKYSIICQIYALDGKYDMLRMISIKI